MSLSDLRVVLCLSAVVGLTILTTLLLGDRAVYWILGFHTIMNALWVTFFLVAIGEL